MNKILLFISFGLMIFQISCVEQKTQLNDPELLKKEFYIYYSQLIEYRKKPEVRSSSDTRDWNNCEAFRMIVNKGEKFIPFIIDEIKNGDFFLNQAMDEITGLNMYSTAKVQELMKSKVVFGEQTISKLWVEWWEENKSQYHDI